MATSSSATRILFVTPIPLVLNVQSRDMPGVLRCPLSSARPAARHTPLRAYCTRLGELYTAPGGNGNLRASRARLVLARPAEGAGAAGQRARRRRAGAESSAGTGVARTISAKAAAAGGSSRPG